MIRDRLIDRVVFAIDQRIDHHHCRSKINKSSECVHDEPNLLMGIFPLEVMLEGHYTNIISRRPTFGIA
jgi:hypothetical protein